MHTPGHKNGLRRLNLFNEDLLAVIFEDELAIIHQENANVVSVETTSYHDEDTNVNNVPVMKPLLDDHSIYAKKYLNLDS